MTNVLGVTGHRIFADEANTKWAWKQVSKAIKRAQEKGFTLFCTGMAPGADIVAGETAVSMGMSTHAVIPFPKFVQTSVFDEHWRNRYNLLMEKVSGFEYVAGDGYHQGAAYLLRDRVLVHKCDAILAVYDGREEGGTCYTFNYALSNKKNEIPVYWIDPVKETCDWVFP